MYLQEIVNKYYPETSIYESMDVWSLPKHKTHMIEKVCESGEYFAQLKKDGNWYQFSKSKTGKCYMFSRGESKKTGLPVENIAKMPHLENILNVLPNETVIIGEIYYPEIKDNGSDEVGTILRCLPPKAISRQKEKGYLHFYIHDILKYDGREISILKAIDRYNALKIMFEYHDLCNKEYIKLANIVTENIYEFVLEALNQGEEGVVLKLKTSPYFEGKKPAWKMIKWKKHDTIDVVCMGFDNATKDYDGNSPESWTYWVKEEDGTRVQGNYHNIPGYIPVKKPYFYNWKTSIQIGLYDEEGNLKQIGNVSSGLTDELRQKFAEEPEKYIGEVLVCDCMQLNEESLRHPKFIRFRNDKPARACTIKSIFN